MQNKGLKVGKVLAAIQITPEAADGRLIQRIQSGDRIVIDSEQGSSACTQPLASGANLPNLVMARMLVWAGSYSRFLETVCLVLTLVRAWCYERIELIPAKRIVPVVVINDAAHAVPLAEALVDSGIESIEVTLRTSASDERDRDHAQSSVNIKVGAGSVATPDQLRAVRGIGAEFAVCPGATGGAP